MHDLTTREWAAILPLLILMFWMGIYSQTFMPAISAQNAAILDSAQSRTVRAAAPAVEVNRAH